MFIAHCFLFILLGLGEGDSADAGSACSFENFGRRLQRGASGENVIDQYHVATDDSVRSDATVGILELSDPLLTGGTDLMMLAETAQGENDRLANFAGQGAGKQLCLVIASLASSAAGRWNGNE
jgi:hypothetical protein